MVENAIRELYEYECVTAAKKAALAVSDSYAWNRPVASGHIVDGASQASCVTYERERELSQR